MADATPEPSGHRDAAFGLAFQGEQLLLVENPRVIRGRPQACWDLPGGALLPQEDLREGLGREWAEETGLEAVVKDLLWVVDGRKQRPGGPVLYTWRAFCFEVQSVGEPRPGPGIRAAAWVPVSQAQERLSAPYHGPARAWLSGDRRRHHVVHWEEAAPADEDPNGHPAALMALVAAAAVGASGEIQAHVREAQAAGESAARIVEALLQVVPYAGFPRAIHALTLARSLLGPPAAQAAEAPVPAHPALGAETFARVYDASHAAVRAGLERLEPRLARWTLEFAYGRVLAPANVLTLLEREWLAVAMLGRLGNLHDPLLGHQRALDRLRGERGQDPASSA